MRRPGNQEKTLERIRAWRAIAPDLTIRSTFIVGFPGETEEDFRLLLDWLDEAKLDRVGAFKYEPVRGARANDLGLEPVPDEVKESRWRRFMEKQQRASPLAKQKAKVGQRPRRADRRGRPARRQGPQQGRRAARSTAPCMSPRAARCAPATSSASRSSAPTPTISRERRSEAADGRRHGRSRRAKVDAVVGKAGAWGARNAGAARDRAVLPADEEIKWGQPCYTCDGKNIVLIHGFKDYCALLFFKGALMTDPQGLLIQQTENVQSARQIRFAGLAEIERASRRDQSLCRAGDRRRSLRR